MRWLSPCLLGFCWLCVGTSFGSLCNEIGNIVHGFIESGDSAGLWMSTGPLHLLYIKDMIQPHGNPPVNYPASENDVSRGRKLALNIYKSPITDLNEPFQRDSGGSTKGEKWPCKGRERGEEGNNSVEAGRGEEKKSKGGKLSIYGDMGEMG